MAITLELLKQVEQSVSVGTVQAGEPKTLAISFAGVHVGDIVGISFDPFPEGEHIVVGQPQVTSTSEVYVTLLNASSAAINFGNPDITLQCLRGES